MITNFRISNFKRLGSVDLELGHAAVFIGPNNSGKTTALQALALWDIGWKRWAEKRDRSAPAERRGVTINRRDLSSIPVPGAKLLWSGLRTHIQDKAAGKTGKIYITLEAEGVDADQPWSCALEFYYANEESLYCRLKHGDKGKIPAGARKHSVVFLPPMSGLAAREHRKEPGEINVLIGEGQTAQVLRNLCWQLSSRADRQLKHDHRRPRIGQLLGMLTQHAGRLVRLALNAIPAERMHRLRRQPQMTAHRHAALGQKTHRLRRPAATFELDHLRARLHEQSSRRHRL